jgi:hypothetical protein
MLAHLGRPNEVEVLGLILSGAGRRDLLTSMGVVETASEPARAGTADTDQSDGKTGEELQPEG